MPLFVVPILSAPSSAFSSPSMTVCIFSWPKKDECSYSGNTQLELKLSVCMFANAFPHDANNWDYTRKTYSRRNRSSSVFARQRQAAFGEVLLPQSRRGDALRPRTLLSGVPGAHWGKGSHGTRKTPEPLPFVHEIIRWTSSRSMNINSLTEITSGINRLDLSSYLNVG